MSTQTTILQKNTDSSQFDLIILGAGPAGVAAGVYAARKKLKTLVLTKNFEGQSTVSDGIKNWIGDIDIPGPTLSKKLEEHLRSYEAADFVIKDNVSVADVKKESDMIFHVTTESGETYSSKTILVTTGSHRRKLAVPGALEFDHKGLTYCASCDGPLFTGKDVVVVGGGNAGFESAAQLLAYTKSVTIFEHGNSFAADPITVKKVLSHPNAIAIKNAEIKEVKGSMFVESIVYTNRETSEDIELKTSGVFVEIGTVPSTDFIDQDLKNNWGKIITDPKNQRTKKEGIWAAGDCTDGLYQQNNIAVGDAVKALEDIYLYLNAQ